MNKTWPNKLSWTEAIALPRGRGVIGAVMLDGCIKQQKSAILTAKITRNQKCINELDT